MIQLLFGAANLAMTICFFIICWKATTLLKEKIGLPAAALFVIGLALLASNGYRQANIPDQQNDWTFTGKDSTHHENIKLKEIELEGNLISRNKLYIYYSSDSTKFASPTSASSSTEGLTFNTKWIPTSLAVTTTGNARELKYILNGKTDWTILGAVVYTQEKTYEDVVFVN